MVQKHQRAVKRNQKEDSMVLIIQLHLVIIHQRNQKVAKNQIKVVKANQRKNLKKKGKNFFLMLSCFGLKCLQLGQVIEVRWGAVQCTAIRVISSHLSCI